LNQLDGAHHFQYIAIARGLIMEEYFIQTHMLRKGPRSSIIMTYHGHTAEVPLLCERL
jgi:hypothetical protein